MDNLYDDVKVISGPDSNGDYLCEVKYESADIGIDINSEAFSQAEQPQNRQPLGRPQAWQNIRISQGPQRSAPKRGALIGAAAAVGLGVVGLASLAPKLFFKSKAAGPAPTEQTVTQKIPTKTEVTVKGTEEGMAVAVKEGTTNAQQAKNITEETFNRTGIEASDLQKLSRDELAELYQALAKQGQTKETNTFAKAVAEAADVTMTQEQANKRLLDGWNELQTAIKKEEALNTVKKLVQPNN
jgi:hypothetical protein